MNMDAPKLKRSPYLSSMVSGGNGGGWSISSSTDTDGISDSGSNSSARYHPAAAATATSTSSNNNIKPQPPRRKLCHALNEGSSYSRDYFNLRRPKGTQHSHKRSLPRNNNGGGAAELTSTSTHGAQSALSIHSMFSPYINPNNNNNSSMASFSSTTSAASIVSTSAASGHGGGKMKIQRRRRTSTSKHPTPQQQLSQLSSSAPLSSSPPKLQYYYPNPFSTTNLRDMIRLHQESTTEGDENKEKRSGETTSTSGSSTQPSSSPSPQIMSELDDDDEEEEMMEDVAPLGAPLYHHQTQGKKHRVPSAYRSLPQLGCKGGFTHNHTIHHQGSSRIQQMSSYNFFQQVLLDPIDGVEDDINRFKRNEGWKEIRMYADDDDELGLGGGGGDGSGRRDVGYLNQLMVDSVDSTSSSGRITNNSDGMGAGIVSDDNDGSAGEEDTANNNKGVGVQKYWKRKLSVESSTSSYEEEEEDGSSPPRHLPAAGASSSSSLRRSRNTVGAGLAYGSDTLRSYQSRSSSR